MCGLAVTVLIKALSDERELVRAEVTTSLGELGMVG
jgi:HEAT repeat protein